MLGYPFLALTFSGVANVGLNLFFVIALRMGVAVATGISNMLSALLVLLRLSKESKKYSAQKPQFSMHDTAEILKTGFPSAIQGAVFCLANIFVQASVNGFGETAIAAARSP